MPSSERCRWQATKNRKVALYPKRRQRSSLSEWSGSAINFANSSTNTGFAASKWMPCLFRFAVALDLSHWNWSTLIFQYNYDVVLWNIFAQKNPKTVQHRRCDAWAICYPSPRLKNKVDYELLQTLQMSHQIRDISPENPNPETRRETSLDQRDLKSRSGKFGPESYDYRMTRQSRKYQAPVLPFRMLLHIGGANTNPSWHRLDSLDAEFHPPS